MYKRLLSEEEKQASSVPFHSEKQVDVTSHVLWLKLVLHVSIPVMVLCKEVQIMKACLT